MSQFNQREKDICCAPDLWSSADYSIRQLINATASATIAADSTSKPPHSKKLMPSFSVSSFCPSLSDTTNQSQSSSQQGTPPSHHFPVHNKKPIKSAMKRSSGHHSVKNGKAPIHPSECIPSGLAGGSIIMPTGGGYQQIQQNQISSQQHQQQHHQSSNNANGYISPQYGWYISMTPPTPPHYHDTSQINRKDAQLMQPQQQASQPQQKSQNGHMLQINNQNTRSIKKPTTCMTTATNDFIGGRVVPSKPVFTRSLKGVPNNTSGWPSVPL